MNDSHHIGENFQQGTKYTRASLDASPLNWSTKPETYKEYPQSPFISLPQPVIHNGPGIWQTIMERRSERDFSGAPISREQLSQLLWAGQGITRQIQGYELRSAPSAGALYPIETYLCINDVTGIDSGIFHYNIRRHGLEQIQVGNLGGQLAAAALGQPFCATANVVFIWTAVFERSVWKYKQRAFRYIYLDAGHIGHATALAAVALDLGSCQIAAFFDDEVNQLIGVDGDKESVVYLTAVGTI